MTCRSATWLLALCLWAWSAPVRAQVTLDPYRPAPMGNDGFAVSRPVVPARGDVDVQVQLTFAEAPATPQLTMATEVERAMVDHLLGSVGLGAGVALFAQLPVVIMLQTQAAEEDGGQQEFGGLGDAALGARYRITAPDSRFGVALEGTARLPTGSWLRASQRFVGDRTGSYELAAVGGLRSESFRVSGRLGARLRGATTLAGQRFGQALTWGVGAATSLNDEVSLHAEAFGSTQFGDLDTSPMEVLCGLRYRLGGSLFGLAGGAGLGNGYGAPDWRAVLQLGFEPGAEPAVKVNRRVIARARRIARARHRVRVKKRIQRTGSARVPRRPPDTDGDGVPDPKDACPQQAEDHDGYEDGDGCPEPDDDGDQINDGFDACPGEAEDVDSFEDEDGCPDPDNDGDGVVDVQDLCPLKPGSPENNGCEKQVAASRILSEEPVRYASGKADILPGSISTLKKVYDALSRETGIRRIRIVGHTDLRGRASTNMELSRRRAASVARWLVKAGAPRDRIEVVGCGELNPVDRRTTRAADQANRRVALEVSDPPAPVTEMVPGCQTVPDW